MCSVKQLIDDLPAEWLIIDPELCKTFVFSMAQRIQKCTLAHGRCIDY